MEVIALEGTGDKRTPEHVRLRTNMKPRKALKHYPYFVDPSIVPRVKQYLEDNKDKVYVDIDDMVTELQRKYRDYAKRKRPAFKGMVEKAFSVVLKTYNVNTEDIHRDDSESSDVSGMDVDSEEADLIVEPNISNNQVMNMYMQQQALRKLAGAQQGSMPEGAKELIDISSDDDDDGEEQSPVKRTKRAEGVNHDNTTLPGAETLMSKLGKETVVRTNGQATPKEVGVAQVQPASTTSVTAAPAVPSVTPPVVTERPKRKRTAVEGGMGPSSASLNGDVSKKRRREVPVVQPCCSFKDVGGSSVVLQEVCKLLIHLRHPEIFEQIGISPPRGFLLHGPPGCGKTLLANAIAGELGFPLIKVSAPELVAGVSGESEERIRDLFDQAVSIAPCVLFLDEIDAITPNRNNAQREMERRIVAQLLTTLDELSQKEGGNQVLVVGATNRPDALDPALRRAGRFDREVCMGIPDKEARAHILRVVCGRLALSPDVSSDAGIEELASLTPGFVGADLTALTREAAMVAVNRILAQIQKIPADGDKPETGKESTSGDDAPVNASVEETPKTEESVAPKDVEKMETDNQQPMDSTEVAEVSKVTDGLVQLAEQACKIINTEELTSRTDPVSEQVIADKEEEEVVVANVQQSSDKEEKVDDSSAPSDNITCDAKEGVSVVTPDVCPPGTTEDIEVIPQSINVEEPTAMEASEDIPPKIDNDVEVLEEVKLVNGAEQPVEASSVSVDKADEDLATEKEEERDLALSQKLLPSAMYSSELCQLMSWLSDVPPLTSAQLSDLTITMADFHEALRHVQPSAKREGFATVPDVTWDDVGSLKNVRAELQLCVLAPVRYAKQFLELGLSTPAGVLLCGPPGCGKTLLAKAVANEAGINFISVKGPELLNMYVGESERAVRQVFQRARNSAPCVIFFDELDALCPRRSDSGDNGVSSRVVNQLLTEMDGVEGRAAVFLMAASNRPDIIDPAVLRPGRLDKIVYVGMPNAEDRKDILRALTKNGTRPLLSSDVDLSAIANRPQLEGYSGADLASLVREAGVQALQEFIGNGGDPAVGPLSVALRHFDAAAGKIRPSVTGKARKHYEKLQEMYCSPTVDSKSEVMQTDSGS